MALDQIHAYEANEWIERIENKLYAHYPKSVEPLFLNILILLTLFLSFFASYIGRLFDG